MSVGNNPAFGYTTDVRTLFKRFLLVFMMLALPVQAFASAAMLGCEPMRVQTQVSMDETMANCHEAPAEQSGTPAGEHQCKHCTACYLATGLPIPVSGASYAAPAPHIPPPHPAAQFSGFIPEGPERPPRTSLV